VAVRFPRANSDFAPARNAEQPSRVGVRLLKTLASVSLALCLAAPTALATETEPLHVDGLDRTGCADEEFFMTSVRARSARIREAAPGETARALRVVIETAADGTYRGELTVIDDAREGAWGRSRSIEMTTWMAGLATGGIYHVATGVAESARSRRSVPAQGVSAPTARASQGRIAPAAISVRVPSIAVQSEAPRALASGTHDAARSEVIESTVPADSEPTARVAADLALSDELRAIERVRGALSAGDASGALRELERYESARHAGRFRIEADVLRIEALMRLGKVAEARALAMTFLSKHPGSPYVRRVSTLLGEAQ
jgi:hypothetical protein